MAIEIQAAFVGKTGQTIAVAFRDTSTLKHVTLSVGSGDATISINGGAPITLAVKKIDRGLIFLPSLASQTFTVSAGNTVTLSAPSGWVTSSSGSSPTLTNQALTNYTGTEHVTIQQPTGSMPVGWNLHKPSYFNPSCIYVNALRGANRFGNASSTYDSNGYPTAISGTTEAIVLRCQTDSEDWVGLRSGTWRVGWDGASGNCTLAAQTGNGSTTVVETSSSTGNATGNYREYSVTVNTQPGGIKWAVTAVPVSNVKAYRTSDNIADKFRADFIRQLNHPSAIRFLDACDTNSSNVIDYADFTTSSAITYFRRQNQQSAVPASFTAWTNDGSFEDSDRVYVKCTTTASHGFTTGMTVDFSGTNAIACNSGAFTIAAGSNRLIKVIDATSFSFAVFRSGGGTVDGTQSQPGSASVLIDIAGTMPVADMVELCNLVGADMWINIPHLATDACVSSLAAYIAANLDGTLKCICEYTNEHWNGATDFNQYRYCYMQGQFDATIVAATSNKTTRGRYWYAQRAGQVHDLFEAEWNTASRPLSTLVRLIGSQYGGTQVTTDVLTWAITQLGNQVDAIGFAPYWGPTDWTTGDDTLFSNECSVDQLADYMIAQATYDYRRDVERFDAQTTAVGAFGSIPWYAYETGAVLFAYGNTVGPEKSRAVGRHPRVRYGWNLRLKKMESQGFVSMMQYVMGGANGSSTPGSANTNWQAWSTFDQVAGLGDGSDALFDNRTAYDDHGQVVSVQGYAIHEWQDAMELTAGVAIIVPRPANAIYLSSFMDDMRSYFSVSSGIVPTVHFVALRRPNDFTPRRPAASFKPLRKPLDFVS